MFLHVSHSSARAVFDYDATQQDEISFHEGDVIEIFTKNEDGWFHGKLTGTYVHGLFPGTSHPSVSAIGCHSTCYVEHMCGSHNINCTASRKAFEVIKMSLFELIFNLFVSVRWILYHIIRSYVQT